MDYRERPVGSPLDAFVECIWFLSTPRGECAAARQTILPDGCIEVIFHLGAPFLASADNGIPCAQPTALVAGMLTGPLRVSAVPSAESVGIRFRPGGAYPFFAAPLSLLTDRVTPLDEAWGADARELGERLHEATSDEARAAIACAALTKRLIGAALDRPLGAAVYDVVRSAGRLSVGAVATRTGMSSRHLQRRFASRVGVTPKMLSRILRFQNTLRRARGERPDWLRIAIECGYTDQSHLIHDYASLSGETPASLRAATGELSYFLSAYFTTPQRLAALFDARR
jgi:AraC-like DNA-binding protein